jgi:hypothetical protein
VLDKSHFGSISLGPLIQSSYRGDPAYNNASRTLRISKPTVQILSVIFLKFSDGSKHCPNSNREEAVVGVMAADVASAMEHYLANLADPGVPNMNVVNAFSLKLPEFNPSRILVFGG